MKALRVNAELNQAEAAKRIGVNISTLSNWEIYASFPTLDQLLTLCKVYGCTLDDIRLPDTLAKSEDSDS